MATHPWKLNRQRWKRQPRKNRRGLRGRLNRAFTLVALVAVLFTNWGTLRTVEGAKGCMIAHFDPCPAQFIAWNLTPSTFSLLSRSSLIAALLAGGLASVVAAVITRRITAPLSRLADAAHRMAQGERGIKLSLSKSNDEIRELTQAFNQLNEGLERQETWRRNMVADVAHDLRTPLAVMRAEIEAMQDGLAVADGAGLDRLHAEVLLLARLVGDLHTLSQAEGGVLSLDMRPFEMGVLLGHLAETYHPKAETFGMTVRLESVAEELWIHADPDRLSQVIYNLMDNAVHYAGQNSIELGAQQKGDIVEIWVRDHGPGLSSEALIQVFERFYRVDSSRARDPFGRGNSGLGLAIAKALIEAQKGTIGVENHPEGGARFWLRFDSLVEQPS